MPCLFTQATIDLMHCTEVGFGKCIQVNLRDGWLSLEGWVAKSEGWVAKSRDGWLSHEGWVAKSEGWVAKSVARQLATAALWVRIQTSLKNKKWAT
jgi:hypothetical protein